MISEFDIIKPINSLQHENYSLEQTRLNIVRLHNTHQ
jgi:hypothetical protein